MLLQACQSSFLYIRPQNHAGLEWSRGGKRGCGAPGDGFGFCSSHGTIFFPLPRAHIPRLHSAVLSPVPQGFLSFSPCRILLCLSGSAYFALPRSWSGKREEPGDASLSCLSLSHRSTKAAVFPVPS